MLNLNGKAAFAVRILVSCWSLELARSVDHHTSPLIFAFCRDCLSYLASAETVRDLLLPVETVVLGK